MSLCILYITICESLLSLSLQSVLLNVSPIGIILSDSVERQCALDLVG